MSDRLPLTEVGGDEILARVVYQIILHDYHSHPHLYDDPVHQLLDLALIWGACPLHTIPENLSLCAIWVANGGTVATWVRARIVFTTGRATRLLRAGRSRRR